MDEPYPPPEVISRRKLLRKADAVGDLLWRAMDELRYEYEPPADCELSTISSHCKKYEMGSRHWRTRRSHKVKIKEQVFDPWFTISVTDLGADDCEVAFTRHRPWGAEDDARRLEVLIGGLEINTWRIGHGEWAQRLQESAKTWRFRLFWYGNFQDKDIGRECNMGAGVVRQERIKLKNNLKIASDVERGTLLPQIPR